MKTKTYLEDVAIRANTKSVLNADLSDFSPKYMLQFSTLVQLIYAVDILSYRITSKLDACEVAGSFLQNRRWALKQINTSIKTICNNLHYVFDDSMGLIAAKGPGYYNHLQEYGIDLLQLCLLFVSRTNGNEEVSNSILRAIHNYKPSKPEDFGGIEGIDEVIRSYKVRHFDNI